MLVKNINVNMKKLKLYFVAMLLSAVAINSFAQQEGTTITVNGVTYTYLSIPDRTVSVTGIDVSITGTEVTIPASIKDSEGNFTYAVTTSDFTNNSIIKLTLPEGLKTIKKITCGSLKEITIPSSVTEISPKTTVGMGFSGCSSLKNIFVAEGNTEYSDEDGVLLTNKGTELLEYPMGRTDTEYTVPSGVTTIKSLNAIQNSSLTSLSFGTNVTTVSAYALSLPNVTDVTIPVSLTSVTSLTGLSKLVNYHVASGHSTYSDINGVLFNQDGTTLIGYPIGRKGEQYKIPSSTVTIAESACLGVSFNTVDFSEAVNLKTISERAFVMCKATGNLVLDLSKTKVETISNSAFLSFLFGEKGSKKVILPETIKTIGASAFQDCEITEINLPEGLESLGNNALQLSKMSEITIPASLTSFGTALFEGNTNLKAINIVEGNVKYASYGGVVYTKNYDTLVFYPRGKDDKSYTIHPDTKKTVSYSMQSCLFEEIEIPESLEEIGVGTFSGAKKLTNIVWPENCKLKIIGGSAFRGCIGLKTFDLPISVESMGILVFSGCTFTEFKIPDNSQLKTLYLANWNECPLKKLTIGENTHIGNIVGGTTSPAAYSNTLETLIIEKGNGKINPLQFFHRCFQYIYSIKEIIIADDCVLYALGNSCFEGCEKLTTLTFPSSVQTLGTQCFYKTPNLKTITFADTDEHPAQLASIGENCFWECGIESFTVPRSVKTISRQAFHSCEVLETVSIPAGTTSVDKEAFYLCNKLKAIDVDKANETYSSSDGIFCNKMKEDLIIYPAGKSTDHFQLLPPSLTKIGSMSFFYSKNLKSVMIPKHVASIGISAFFGCDNLSDIVLLGDAPIEGVADVENAFPADIATKAKLWVRYGTKAAYQADPFWGQFSNIEETKMGEAADGDENHNYEFFPMAEGSANVLSVKNNKLDYTIVMPEMVSDGTNEYKVDYLGDYMLEDAQENVKEVVVKHTPKYVGANAFDSAFGHADAFFCADVEDMSTIRFEYDKATFNGRYNEGQNLYMKKSVAEGLQADETWTDLADVIKYQVPLPTVKTDYGTFSREFAVDLDAINPDKENPNVIAFTAGNAHYDKQKNLTTVTMVSINHTGEKLDGWSGEGDGTYIPANTGVLLKAYNGSSTADDYYQIAETQTDGYADANLMASVTEHSRKIQPTENGMKNFYVAQGKLWSFSAERTSTVHKSYLQLSEDVAPAGAKLAMVFVNPGKAEPTGIESISADADDSDNLYNLQGQRVNTAGKGIYIKNGKKILK